MVTYSNVPILPWVMVDLDLPSGTLWADRNIGASSESDLGDYYSWGDTELKTSWSSSTTPTYGKNFDTLKAEGYVDEAGNLTPAYDIAYITSSGACRMPTKEQFQELYDNTDQTWVTVAGHAGYKFASKTNPEKYIFVPVAGYRDGRSFINVGLGYVCSSSVYQSNSYYVYYCEFYSDYIRPQSSGFRYYGFSIRAVQNV